MAKYQQYAEYKDSGVEWLDVIPMHWVMSKIKYIASFQVGWTPPTGNDSNFIGENIWANISDLRGKVITDTVKRISDKAVKEASMDITPKGSLLYSFKLSVGSVSFAGCDMYTNEAIASFTSDSLLPLEYLYYVLPKFLIENASTNIYGARILNQELIKNAIILKPTYEEAKTIANFLDYQTAQIDTLIDKQQTLIQLLKEKRQAVISHAVTKGLNPDAPMKDSGVEWLGEVPEHWEVGRVGYYGQVLNGSTPSKANLSYWHPKEVAWLSSGEVNQYYIESPTDYISYKALKECSVTLLPVGTLVMGMIGQGKTRGTSAVTKIEATINQNLAAVIPNENLYSNYAHLFFQAAYKELREDARGGNQAALNCEIIRDFKITIPPINEQRTIFIEVNKISDKFDILIVKAEQAIELMQERRTALISAAVTGKIDVRGWVKPNFY